MDTIRPGSSHARPLKAAVSLALCAAFSTTYAQSTTQTVEELELVIVTGTRIARDVTDASTPLAIISADEIKLSGSPDRRQGPE